jgi:SPP1 gp7 family putative phage head morphogenesis protein
MSVYTDARAFQDAVEGLADPALLLMAQELGRALPTLAAQAETAAARVQALRDAGELVSALQVLASERASFLRRRVEAEIAAIMGALAGRTAGLEDDAIRRGLEAARSLVLAQAPVPWATPNLDAVRALVGAAQGMPLGGLLRALGADAGRRVQDHLTRGLLTGRNPRTVAKAVSQEVALSAVRAQTIASTELLRAFRVASAASYAANPGSVKGWRWLAAKQVRTCLNCLSRDGSTWPVDKPLPAHPRCRCTMVPVVELPGVQQARIQTGREWFESQSADAQRVMMGKGAFEAYRKGQITLADFEGLSRSDAWGESTYQRSLKEIREAG